MVHVSPVFRGQIFAVGFRLTLFSSFMVAAPHCKSRSESDQKSSARAAASLASHEVQPKPRRWPAPSGPVLAVLAGQGVGPIRIGATVSTIERLMELPCELKTPDVCRYLARGIEFRLKDGITESIYIQRAGRPSDRGTEFGVFNGGIPPDLRLGMLPTAIQEFLGAPQKVERSGVAGPAFRVEIHHYPGLRIEYDRLENGKLVMAGILIMKEPASSGLGTAGQSSSR